MQTDQHTPYGSRTAEAVCWRFSTKQISNELNSVDKIFIKYIFIFLFYMNS